MLVTSVPGEEAAARAHAHDASGDAASTVIPHIRPRALVVGAALIPIAVGVSQSLFLVWAIKASLLRWGGLRAYRRAFPFFAALVIGEALMQAAWAGINAGIGTKFYTCTE